MNHVAKTNEVIEISDTESRVSELQPIKDEVWTNKDIEKVSEKSLETPLEEIKKEEPQVACEPEIKEVSIQDENQSKPIVRRTRAKMDKSKHLTADSIMVSRRLRRRHSPVYYGNTNARSRSIKKRSRPRPKNKRSVSVKEKQSIPSRNRKEKSKLQSDESEEEDRDLEKRWSKEDDIKLFELIRKLSRSKSLALKEILKKKLKDNDDLYQDTWIPMLAKKSGWKSSNTSLVNRIKNLYSKDFSAREIRLLKHKLK